VVVEASGFKQIRSKTSDKLAYTYNTNGRETEERNNIKQVIMKEKIKDRE
jgi:hypothetical protein